MAKTSSGWVFNSLILNFITQPFRWALIFLLAILIVFFSSLVSQSVFGTSDQLYQEIEVLKIQSQQQSWLNTEWSKKPVNISVTRASYALLHGIFFKLTRIDEAWQAQEESDFGYVVKEKFLQPHSALLSGFDRTLKTISVRLGHLSYFAGLAIVLCLVGLIDGFVARAIRQKNAGRESAGLYHRAKYWRTGILWLSMIAYLASPTPISPNWLFIPCAIYASLVWLQAKYLKKYL